MGLLGLATDIGLPIRLDDCPEITEEESVNWLLITPAQAFALFSRLKTDISIAGEAVLTVDYYTLAQRTCPGPPGNTEERHDFSGSHTFDWTARIRRDRGCYSICASRILITPEIIRVSGTAPGTVDVTQVSTYVPDPGGDSGTNTETYGPPYVIIGNTESLPQADNIYVFGYFELDPILKLARLDDDFYLFVDLKIELLLEPAGYGATLLLTTETDFTSGAPGEWSLFPDDLTPDGTLALSIDGDSENDILLPYFTFDDVHTHDTDETGPCDELPDCTCVNQDLGTETFEISVDTAEFLAQEE